MSLDYCKARDDFRNFLKTIELDKYRREFKDKKYIEQDLPDDVVNAMLKSLYENYWEKRRFTSFDQWFEELWNRIVRLKGFGNFLWYYWHMKLDERKDWDEWFKEGLKARLYRTWTAILTQFDFSYTIACVLEEEGRRIPTQASPELNKKGIDVRLTDRGKLIDLQVYKVSERKEARGKARENLISVPYPVLSKRELEEKVRSPRTRKKETYEKLLEIFDKYYEELDNGFIVFKKELAKEILKRISPVQYAREFTEKLAKCLRGKECELT